MRTHQDLEALERVRHLCGTGRARAIRESRGLSLLEMAGPVRVDQSTIWRWETGDRRPHGPAALRYGRLLEKLAESETAAR